MKGSYFIRAKKEKNYTVMDNTFLKDNKLSAKAKGLFAYLLSLPDDWKIYMSELKEHFSDGDTSIRSGINELKVAGYVKSFRIKDEKGQFVSIRYLIIENPKCENRILDNQTLLNTNKNKVLKNTKDLFIAQEDKIDKQVDKQTDKYSGGDTVKTPPSSAIPPHEAESKAFKQTIVDFINAKPVRKKIYSKSLLNDFFAYWTEPFIKGSNKGHIKQYGETTWSLEGRLDTFLKYSLKGVSVLDWKKLCEKQESKYLSPNHIV